jgi:hypothetical protein
VAGADDPIDRARAAAVSFWRDSGFALERVAQLERDPPVLGPVAFQRDGRSFTAYRWLGPGRGGAYVQAEVDEETGRIDVHGSPGGPGDAHR